MQQSLLMFFAPQQEVQVSQVICTNPERRMATRPEVPKRGEWKQKTGFVLSVAGNALGFMLFLTGLSLVLRLVEVLLN